MLEDEVKSIIENVSVELLSKYEGKSDLPLLHEFFFTSVTSYLSGLEHEYPILTETIPVTEFQRWSVYWVIKKPYIDPDTSLLTFSIQLFSNSTLILCVYSMPESGILISNRV